MSATAEHSARYTRLAVWLHWIVAALIIVNLLIANLVDFLPDPQQDPVVDVHKSIGLTVLGLVVVRLLWRLANRPPALPGAISRLERIASQVSHGVLYALMLALPLTGWAQESTYKDTIRDGLYLFGVVRVPLLSFLDPARHDQLFDLHSLFGNLLYVLFALHLAAALKHQFIDKQKLLQRMAVR